MICCKFCACRLAGQSANSAWLKLDAVTLLLVTECGTEYGISPRDPSPENTSCCVFLFYL